ncbi:MAG: TetR/AcrR family transcriptional regulator [Halocynthiibacter sp.]
MNDMKSKGWRGNEDLWLQAAFDLFKRKGIDAVKVMPLAKALGMSRSSFYWHFSDRDALLTALIKRWENKNTGNLITQTEAFAESIAEAMLNVFDCWLDEALFDADLDLAIRNWAQNDPNLKSRVQAADTARIAALTQMFLRFGFSQNQSETRAHTVYYTQIGYISMMVQEDLAPRIKRMPAYVETYTDLRPTDVEMARFIARHAS